ncbi:opacity protein-like surface antigen [Nitrobacteraceae bacterium AZCC 2161]
MKKLLLAAPLLGISVVSASAADIAAVPLKSPVVMNSWAGFYLGAHGGYGWGDNSFLTVLSPAPNLLTVGGVNSKGALYGGHAGYNWQFGRTVAGVELDLSGADIKGSSSAFLSIPVIPASLSASRSDDIKYLGSARARLGWLPTDNVLLYGTAGLGWEKVERTESQSQSALVGGLPASVSQTFRSPIDHFGWVAGAGAEVALWNSNWIARAEYLHYDFGSTEATSSFVTTPASNNRIDQGGRQTLDTVRAGLSYKFGVFGASPAIAYAKAPIAAAPSSSSASWAGFYLGVHGGYGWATDKFSTTVSLAGDTVGSIKSAGWIAGGQVGHNWQFDRVVAGLELDFSGAGLDGSSSSPLIGGGGATEMYKFSERVKYLGTARGRLGWLPTGNVLLYGTAGLAWERLDNTETHVTTNAGVTTTSFSTSPVDRFGWVAGAGAESLLFGTNWVARIEYLHYDFGHNATATNAAINFPPTPAVSIASTAGHQTIDVVRAGLSYKFGDPAAASAVPYAKAPRMAALNWTGFYLGVHGGHGWADNSFSNDQGGGQRFEGITSKGWVGGGQAGYNWQFGRAVAGLEADFSVTDLKGDSNSLVSNAGLRTSTWSDDVKYLGTARGRLGWSPLDNVLVYGTGGLAWEKITRTSTSVDRTAPGATNTFVNPNDHFGWVAGVGAETMLWNSNWIGRLEYLHYDFGTIEGTFTSSSTNPAASVSTDRGGRQTIDVVRAGVSYKFGDSGAVVAKY